MGVDDPNSTEIQIQSLTPQERLVKDLDWKLDVLREYKTDGMSDDEFQIQKALVEQKQQCLKNLPDEVASLLVEPNSGDLSVNDDNLNRINRVDRFAEAMRTGKVIVYPSQNSHGQEIYIVSPVAYKNQHGGASYMPVPIWIEEKARGDSSRYTTEELPGFRWRITAKKRK